MTGKQPGFVRLMAILLIAEIVCSLESSMIYVTLSHVYATTGDPLHAGWLITAFNVTAAGAAAICGRLGDIFGRRRALLSMLGIALAGSAISAFAPNLNMIILGRALQGASMAILPLCFGLLREHAPPEKVALGVGLLGGTYAIGTGAGSMIGGIIVEQYRWQGIFEVSAGLAAVAILLTFVSLPSSGRRHLPEKLDLLGGATFVPGIALVLLALTFWKTWSWNAPQVALTMVAGIGILAVWFRHEFRTPNPLINVRLLGIRQVAGANLAMFIFGIGPMMVTLVMIPLLQQDIWPGMGFDLDASLVGSLWFVLTIIGACATIGAGLLARRFGARWIVMGAAILVSIGWCAVILFSNMLWPTVLICGALLVPATSLVYAMTPYLIMEAAPEDRTSEATGLSQVIRTVGMAIGSLMVPYLLSSNLVARPGGSDAPLPGEAAYLSVFVAIAAASATTTAILWVFLQPRTRSDPIQAPPGTPPSPSDG
jgi:MFS family permease